MPIPIIINTSGSTFSRIVFPTTSESVGIGSPIIAQFNNQIKPETVNSNTFKLVSNNGQIVTPQKIIVSEDMESAIFIVTNNYESALNLDTTYTAIITDGIKDISGNNIIESNLIFTTQLKPYILFLTESKFTPNLLSTANALGNNLFTNGIEAADYLCERDNNRPNNLTYKALIVDSYGVYRSAYPTPTNWVLQPYSLYANSQESPAFITGINPPQTDPINPILIYTAVSDVTFNAYSMIIYNTTPFYTGLSDNWTTVNNSTCLSWTTTESTETQVTGLAGGLLYPNQLRISGTYSLCNAQTRNLLCIQQK